MGRIFLVNLILLLGYCGCALSPRVPLSGADSSRYREDFKQMVSVQRECQCCGDADVTVSIDSPWQSGTIGGYMQIMSPSFLKFIGMNPLGQPQIVMVTDGVKFSYALINEARGYEGAVTSEAFNRYAPPGFNPGTSFYWLIGRLPPGPVDIMETSGDTSKRGIWVRLRYESDGMNSLILFDPARKVILQHSKLSEDGKSVLDVKYDNYQSGKCGLPGRITISSGNHHGNLVVDLREWQTGVPFSAGEFEFELPAGFERVEVQ